MICSLGCIALCRYTCVVVGGICCVVSGCKGPRVPLNVVTLDATKAVVCSATVAH
jgi:multisubunit Na+/H+ antiporter MnhF subunit